jgi:hypothetical protein
MPVEKKTDTTKLTTQDPEDISMVKAETVASIEEKLGALGKPTTTPDEVADDKEEDKVDESAVEKETTPDKTESKAKESTPQKTAEDDKPQQFPDAYRRALIHQEWTTEEIDDLIKTDPDKAMLIGKKMYDTTNRLSAQFAAAGKAQSTSAQTVQKVDTTPQSQRGAFQGIDRKKVIEAMDGDERVGNLVDQFNQMLQGQHQQIEELRKNTETRQQEAASSPAANPEVEREVRSFFGDTEFQKTYGDFYGREEDLKKNTGEQVERRVQLFELADNIIAGSIMSGQPMTVSAALNCAHLQVAKDQVEIAIRNGIKKTLVQRQKSMTLVPTGTKHPDKPKTQTEKEAALEERVAERLKGIKC